MKEIIDLGLEKVEYIYHLADIHIRNLKRHKEYRKVFKKFYSNVKRDKLKNAIIYIAGDIAHAKTEMSPELVREVSTFLNECGKLHPTVVITGNHDCNQNNPHRLDVLTPIIENINNPNVHYLRDTGVYQLANLTVGVYSILSHRTEWPVGTDVVGENKICLFHGPVDKSQTDVGFSITSQKFTIGMFDGWDMALLGDIHRRQELQSYDNANKKPVIVYAGSLIQQNHSEYIQGHGYLIWNVNNRTYESVDLPNDSGFLTIDIIENELPQWVYDEIGNSLPKNPKIRARFTKTDLSSVKAKLSELKKLFPKSEITVTRTDTLGNMKANSEVGQNVIGNVRELEFQQSLIRDYLNRQFLLDDETIERILEINIATNDKLVADDVSGNILWIPKTFEFANMFSYGEDNVIDFTKPNGLVGVFAPNQSGKSSVFDALSFCLFDKCSRAFKAAHILNNRKKQFYCKFHFDVNGVDYYIERLGRMIKKDSAVKVDVNFWKDVGGITQSLNGKDRRDTNRIIEQYIGKYEDFILTTLSLQGNNALFIDKSQSDRKDVLSQFVGVDIFDKLYNIAVEENKDTLALIKRFKTDNSADRLVILNDELNVVNCEYAEIKDELDRLRETVNGINDQILERVEKLVTLNDEIKDIDTLTAEKKRITKEIEDIETSSIESKAQLDKFSDVNVSVDELLSNYDEVQLKRDYVDWETYTNLKRDVNHKIEKTELKISSLSEALEHLKEHEYNPDCKICLKNSDTIIRRKGNVEADLDKLNEDMTEYGIQYGRIETELDRIKDAKQRWDVYTDLLNKKAKLEKEINKIKQNRAVLLNNKLKLNNSLEKIENLIKEYYKYETDFKNNGKLNGEVTNLRKELIKIKKDVNSTESSLLDKSGEVSSIRGEINTIMTQIEEIKQLEEQHKLFEYYLEAVSRNGISYELISKVIPVIEGEVNGILSQIVDFGMAMNMDGKNINAYLVEDDRQWPLEMSSGMERFISGLAIRVAMINICNLPRPNFLVVDEGFGSLDSENMTSMYMMFNYLKSQFDFVMVISHIDTMRDIVDQLMEIKKVKGFSNVKFK